MNLWVNVTGGRVDPIKTAVMFIGQEMGKHFSLPVSTWVTDTQASGRTNMFDRCMKPSSTTEAEAAVSGCAHEAANTSSDPGSVIKKITR